MYTTTLWTIHGRELHVSQYSGIRRGGRADSPMADSSFARTKIPTIQASPIVLSMTRGNLLPPYTSTDTRYQGGYFQDSWTFGRFTFKPGVRFEQQSLIGNQTHYILTHNWAPRLGVIIDPFNDHKTKIDASWGRFFEKVPSGHRRPRIVHSRPASLARWYADPGPGKQPNLSPSNYIPGGTIAFQGGRADLENRRPGTGAQFQDEVTGGFEHEFAHNLTFTGRFVYRDLRRIIEDMSGINVTQALAGVPQIYVVGNPSAKLDIFQNSFPCSNPGANCNPHRHRLHQLSPTAPQPKRSRRDPGWLPESEPHLQVHGVDRQQALLECPVLWQLRVVQTVWQLSGIFPQRQWPAGSQHQLHVRFHQLRRRA